VDRAINRQPVAALVGADCASRTAADYAIDRARVITGAREPALYLGDHRTVHAIAISTVSVRVVIPIRIRVVGIRVIERKERKTKVIENNDLVETMEAMKPIIPIEVAMPETLEPGSGAEHWSVVRRHSPCRGSVTSHLCGRSRNEEKHLCHATEKNEFFWVHNIMGF
jgi:hypothetical protein